MKKDSAEYVVAHRGLTLTDELTGFLGLQAAKSKKATVVLDSIHRFDDTPPKIIRGWSDRAPEYLAAARLVREQRPLAHFVSPPHRHAHRAERTGRSKNVLARR